MDQSVKVQIEEDLAQMGIRKGSRFWPFVSMLVAALALTLYLQTSKGNALNELFSEACRGASKGVAWNTNIKGIARECLEKLTLLSDPNTTPEKMAAYEKSAEDKFVELEKRFASEKTNVIERFRTLDELLNPTAPVYKSKLVTTTEGWWRLIVDGSKDYVAGLGGRVGDILRTAGLSALMALLPGIVGMIYRRNFWGWFFVSFVGLFLVVSDVLWRRSDETTVLIALLGQVILLVLALRLRRYSRSAVVGSADLHNAILLVVVVLLAAAIAWPFPEFLWKHQLKWLSHWFYRGELILIVLPLIYTLLRRSDVWSGKTAKNIVVCLDGTTNTPDQLEAGRLAQTNVFKTYKMLKSDLQKTAEVIPNRFNASISKSYGDKQVAFYYSGVGNRFENDPIVQAIGGATGLGASDVVDRAYLDIMRVYQPAYGDGPGDRIFIFGFSRGAAIARLLARALAQRGAPKTVWTLRLFGRHWTLWSSKRDPVHDMSVPVTVLGCWDTVGAFGLAKKIAGIDFQKIDLFKDLTVPDNVEQAYHMVAMDEQREEFEPTLMDPDPINPARIIEVWFAGDHANIGGGWATTKLSDVTLDFLLKKVSSGYAHSEGMVPGNETWGMHLSAVNTRAVAPNSPDGKGYVDIDGRSPFVVQPDALGQLRLWKSALYVYRARELPHHAVISETVFERMANAAPLYAPPGLFHLHDELDKRRDSVDAAIRRFKDTDSLTEQEQQAILAFKDKLRLTRWPVYMEGLNAQPEPPRKLADVLAN